jgi:hypothetical protein
MQLQGNPLRSRTSPRIAKWCRLLGVIQRALGCLVDRPSAAAILTEKSSRCSNGVVEMIVWLVSEFSPPPPQWPCLLLTQYACKVPSHRCTLGLTAHSLSCATASILACQLLPQSGGHIVPSLRLVPLHSCSCNPALIRFSNRSAF